VSFDLETAMTAGRARVDERLQSLLGDGGGGPPALVDAMRYALLGGGKRLRPILCLWAHDMCSGDEEQAVLDTACALECVHAYSLVHDDLPCMDDDDLRRGRPTVHVRYGEAMAVLCGDALLNLAYETVLGAAWRTSARALPVARALAAAASHRGLVGGQVLDLESEGETPTPERVDAIHRAKTGALIRASLVCGGLAAGASDADLARLGRAGDALGLAFQIADDVLDVTAGRSELGKSPGKDAGAGKMTFPALYGLERSRALARAEAERARTELATWPKSEPLRSLAAFCVERAS
jgi:geranylgeranyl diphosphate synthase type II